MRMRLKNVAEIHPGYLNRAKIKPNSRGSHWLVQARDVEAGVLQCGDASLIGFEPEVTSRDILLRDGDVVFMARGAKNYAALLTQISESTLAAASFFIVRAASRDIDPAYLAWFLNQPRAQRYFTQNSGRGVHMPVVRRSVLEQMDIPIPSRAAQGQIAEVFRLALDEQKLTKALLTKRARLMEVVCLRAAEREDS